MSQFARDDLGAVAGLEMAGLQHRRYPIAYASGRKRLAQRRAQLTRFGQRNLQLHHQLGLTPGDLLAQTQRRMLDAVSIHDIAREHHVILVVEQPVKQALLDTRVSDQYQYALFHVRLLGAVRRSGDTR